MQPIVNLPPAHPVLTTAPVLYQPVINQACSSSPFPNTRILDSVETERLHTLLTSEVSLESMSNPMPLHGLLYDLVSYLVSYNNNQLPFHLFYLKGGAVNHTLLGDEVSYSDIDFGFDLHPLFSLDYLKKLISNWAKSKKIFLTNFKIVPDESASNQSPNYFLIVSIPTSPTKIDLQFNVKCQFQSVCTYNSLRIDINQQIIQLSQNKQLTPPVLFCVDGYVIQDAEIDLRASRFHSPNSHLLFEGMRAYCRLITKGILPRFINVENGFIYGLEQQYSDNILDLQTTLANYLPSHLADKQSRILFLLNYEDAVRRSNIKNKDAIRYTLVSIILDYLLSPANPLGEVDNFNLNLLNNFTENCKNILYEQNLKHTSIIEIEQKKFLLTQISNKFLVLDEEALPKPDALNAIDPKNKSIFELFCNLFCEEEPIQMDSTQSSQRCFSPASVASTESEESDAQLPKEDPLSSLKNVKCSLSERYDESLKLISIQSKLSSSERTELIQIIRAIILELVSQKNYESAFNLISTILKKRGYDKFENTSKPFKEHVLGVFWTSLIKDNELNIDTKTQHQISLLRLFFDIPKLAKEPLKECLSQFPKTNENYSEHSITQILEVILFSIGKLDHQTQNTLRNNLLTIILDPKFVDVVLMFFANKCQNKDKLRELKRIIEGYIIGVLSHQSLYANEDIEKMFNFFTLLDVEGENPFKKIFLDRLTPELFPIIKKRLLKLSLDEFRAFFTQYIRTLLPLNKLSQDCSNLVIECITYLLSTEKSEKKKLELFESLILKEIIGKDANIQKYHSILIKNVEDTFFIKKLGKLFPEVAEALVVAQNNSYKGISSQILSQLRKNSLSENDLEKLNGWFEEEINALISSKAPQSKQALYWLICEYLIIHILRDNFDKVTTYFRTICHVLDKDNFEKCYEFICSYAIKKEKLQSITDFYDLLNEKERKLSYLLITIKRLVSHCVNVKKPTNLVSLKVQLGRLSNLKGIESQNNLIKEYGAQLKNLAEESTIIEIRAFQSLGPFFQKFAYVFDFHPDIILNKIRNFFDTYNQLKTTLNVVQLRSYIDEFTSLSEYAYELANSKKLGKEHTTCLIQISIGFHEEIRVIFSAMTSKDEAQQKDIKQKIDSVSAKLETLYNKLIEEYYTALEIISNGLDFYEAISFLYATSNEANLLLQAFYISIDPAQNKQLEEKLKNYKILFRLAEVHFERNNNRQCVDHFELGIRLNKNLPPEYLKKYIPYFLQLKEWEKAQYYYNLTISKCNPKSFNKSQKEVQDRNIRMLNLLNKFRINISADSTEVSKSPINIFIEQYIYTPGSNLQIHFGMSLIKILESLDNEICSSESSSTSAKINLSHEEVEVFEYIVYRILEDLYSKQSFYSFVRLLSLMLKHFEFSYFFDPCFYSIDFRKNFNIFIESPVFTKEKNEDFYFVLFAISLRSLKQNDIYFDAYKDLIYEELTHNPRLVAPLKTNLTKLLLDCIEKFNKPLLDYPRKDCIKHDPSIITEESLLQKAKLNQLQLWATVLHYFHMPSFDTPFPEDRLDTFLKEMTTLEATFKEIEANFKAIKVKMSLVDEYNFDVIISNFIVFNHILSSFAKFFQSKLRAELLVACMQLYAFNRDNPKKAVILEERYNLNYHVILRLIDFYKNIGNEDPENLNLSVRNHIVDIFCDFIKFNTKEKHNQNRDILPDLYTQINHLISDIKEVPSIAKKWDEATLNLDVLKVGYTPK